MARIDTHSLSSEDFDLLYEVESASDSETSKAQPEAEQSRSAPTSSSRQDRGASAERLSGPHEVPVMPYAADNDDGVASVTQQFSSHSVRDEQRTTSSSIKRGPKTANGRGNFVNDGLQYTKSVYNKLWSKDALIAVMG